MDQRMIVEMMAIGQVKVSDTSGNETYTPDASPVLRYLSALDTIYWKHTHTKQCTHTPFKNVTHMSY